MKAGDRIPAGPGYATVLPDCDFETYSEAGFVWNEATQKYDTLTGAKVKGIGAVGAAVYTQHPSAEVLSFQYDLKDGRGPQFWKPGMPNPKELFDYMAAGGLLEAHNSMFEYRTWTAICSRRYGWPSLDQKQLRCSMAKARQHALPGALGDVGRVLNIAHQKDKEGTRLLNKFSIPRNPTKANPARRIRPEEDPVDGPKLYAYNERDIVAESEVSVKCPDLPPNELAYWLADQAINYRGVGVDSPSVSACIDILQQALRKYDAELYALTGGKVAGASKVQQLKAWLEEQGVFLDSLDSEAVDEALENIDPFGHADAMRALEIRQLVGSASVKKIYSMSRMATTDDRLCDMFIYHGPRTGRDAHQDVQPGNLPKAGPRVRWCDDSGCNRPYAHSLEQCPWCGASAAFSRERYDNESDSGWTWHAMEHALQVISCRSLELVEWFFGDALLTISGCVRGMFVAAPGKELICADYSSIEAVVTAELAGEQWRIDAFHRKDDIYLTSASRITGKSLEWYMQNGGKKHPDRQKIGKPAELGLGFGGWIGAWLQFDSSGTFSEEEIKRNIIAWRAASPMVVEMWGGQVRGMPWKPTKFELYGLEGCAIAAIQNPGKAFAYRGITYVVKADVLYCRLLSGKLLTYHRPRLSPHKKWEGLLAISYEGWNTNPKKGARGWIRMETYGGSLFENVVQGTAADVMKYAVPKLEAAGYPIVLRIHDELVAEVPIGFGSLGHFIEVMTDLPEWCKGWPIRAAGWVGRRYRKD